MQSRKLEAAGGDCYHDHATAHHQSGRELKMIYLLFMRSQTKRIDRIKAKRTTIDLMIA